MEPAARMSQHPLGGISGGWRRRLLRFHVPLALASALVLALFTTFPRFDVRDYPVMDTRGGAFFPQELGEDELKEMEDMHRGEGGSMDMEDMHRGREETEDRQELDHGGDDAERTGGDSS